MAFMYGIYNENEDVFIQFCENETEAVEEYKEIKKLYKNDEFKIKKLTQEFIDVENILYFLAKEYNKKGIKSISNQLMQLDNHTRNKLFEVLNTTWINFAEEHSIPYKYYADF